MTQTLVEGAVELLNHFPPKKIISDTMSSSTKVERRKKIDSAQNGIYFGSYVLVYVGTTNTIKRRSLQVIALEASNNPGGAYLETTNNRHRCNQASG